jgi:hypothetical protein
MDPAYTGALVSLVFQGEGSRSCIKGEHGALSSSVCPRQWDFLLSNGDWSCVATSTAGTRGVELQVILPILPMIRCFSICGFREGFVIS